MLTIEEIKKMHDRAYAFSQETRERAAEDIIFYWITHWDGSALTDSQLAYRGEFDILRKAGRGILADLASNPVQVDFQPRNEDNDDAADLLDGMYRNDSNHNMSIEAFATAKQEAVICGVGAWELFTEYESMRSNDNRNQVIRRKPIHMANNVVFFDPDAQLLDKSDALFCSKLAGYSEEGYRRFVEDLTGEEPTSTESFAAPEQAYSFSWFIPESKTFYISEFYHKEKVKEKVLVMSDPFGDETTIRESELESIMDEMLDQGYEVVEEKKITRWRVTKYIVSGKEILAHYVLPGEYIPIVPNFGEHAFVAGQEHWEGIVKLAVDPQRLRNFQLSFLADIVSRSPRPKPIFFPEQIAGFEHMYAMSGADNNYPYLLQNRKTAAGEDLPIGPVAQMPEQPMPVALIQSIELSRQAVEDVANPGIPQDTADVDLSGKAVLALQNRIDMQGQIYQEHYKHALRYDGVVYASMASELYDVPRKVWSTKADGTREQVQLMETIIDKQTGDIVTLHDISNIEFDVFADIGASYTSKREQTVERLTQLVSAMEPGNPMRQALLLKIMRLMDGVDFEDLREYANKQLIIQGFKEPETDEEKKILADSQQGKAPDANMVLAMAEEHKAEAAKLHEQINQLKTQLDYQIQQEKNKISAFEAGTKRAEAEVKAHEAGANIDNKRADTLIKQVDAQARVIQMRQPSSMSDDELLAELSR